MALSLDHPSGRAKSPPAAKSTSESVTGCNCRPSGRAGFQLLDQRLDLAAVVLDVGIEIGTSSHDHADALDLDVGDARALAGIAHLPLDGDRLAVGLVELAVDHRDAVGPGGDPADDERLAAILAEALA